jgi:hypothetical protein
MNESMGKMWIVPIAGKDPKDRRSRMKVEMKGM